MSRATTLTSVAQQLSLSVGISIGAIALELDHARDRRRDHRQRPSGRRSSWSALITLPSLIPFLRLAARRRRRDVGPPPARARPGHRHARARLDQARRGSPWRRGRARPTAARLAGGLTWWTVAKSRFSRASSSPSVPPRKTLATKCAAGLQHRRGEVGRRLAECDGAQMVGLAVAGGRRRHVGEHEVGRRRRAPRGSRPARRRRGNPASGRSTPGIGSMSR